MGQGVAAVVTRQHKVHTQLGRVAVQMFAANDRMNQVLIEHLDPAAWRAKPPGNVRTIAAIFTHVHNVRTQVGQAYGPSPEGPTTAQSRALHAGTRRVRDWPRALLVAGRCSPKRSAEEAESTGFAETAGPRCGRLARRCSATCLLMKPTIAGRCVCSRINSDSRCRTRLGTGPGTGRSFGRSAARLRALATILEETHVRESGRGAPVWWKTEVFGPPSQSGGS